MTSEVTYHPSLYILLVKASDTASPDSEGRKIDSTSQWRNSKVTLQASVSMTHRGHLCNSLPGSALGRFQNTYPVMYISKVPSSKASKAAPLSPPHHLGFVLQFFLNLFLSPILNTTNSLAPTIPWRWYRNNPYIYAQRSLHPLFHCLALKKLQPHPLSLTDGDAYGRRICRAGSYNLGTTGILDWIILYYGSGVVLWIIGLAASLASTHLMPIAPPSFEMKNVSRHCQMSPGWGRVSFLV